MQPVACFFFANCKPQIERYRIIIIILSLFINLQHTIHIDLIVFYKSQLFDGNPLFSHVYFLYVNSERVLSTYHLINKLFWSWCCSCSGLFSVSVYFCVCGVWMWFDNVFNLLQFNAILQLWFQHKYFHHLILKAFQFLNAFIDIYLVFHLKLLGALAYFKHSFWISISNIFHWISFLFFWGF